MRKIFIIMLIIVQFIIVTQSKAHSKDRLPPLIDIAELKLKVFDTKVVDQISATGTAVGWMPGKKPTISAKKGAKLVVVTLEGTVKQPCCIPLRTNEFAAVYEMEDFYTKQLQYTVQTSFAVAKDLAGDWALPPHGSNINMTFCIDKPGLIIIRAAFALPQQINSFHVRYPTLAQGKATTSPKLKNDEVGGSLGKRNALEKKIDPQEACEEECKKMFANGELKQGMTVEECIKTLCK